MQLVDGPGVYLIAYPQLDWKEIHRYLKKVGGDEWAQRVESSDLSDGEALVEFGGRICYRSWKAGLNTNVTKVREDSNDYLGNIVSSKHGSVLEHANYSFVFDDVSRVFTHEVCRHRAGVSISQESLRYVRLDDISFWFPEWARNDEELMRRSVELLHKMEEHQLWMADRFGLDDEGVSFSEKKAKTSFMRRLGPDGLGTRILCTINIRALRHIIHLRTSLGAEEEIRIVFDKVAEICKDRFPALMKDYDPNEFREWIPDWIKI